MMIDESAIQLRYAALEALLDERSRRRFAAAEALSAGHGGVTVVSRITGIARITIGRGLEELPARIERRMSVVATGVLMKRRDGAQFLDFAIVECSARIAEIHLRDPCVDHLFPCPHLSL
jgi:hypothetical protein